jgi:chromate reductase, NAD(P)H dehydrogenase (quinone)
MRVLAFAASLRRGSLNRRLISLAARLASDLAQVEVADFRDFAMPMYDGDLQEAEGLPAGALEFKRRLELADALLLSVPEYNYSIPGTLKNAIDWVSRARPMPWRGKSIYLMSASTSAVGGIRGLWQTRVPLEGCGALVFPDMFSLPNAGSAFDERGDLVDGKRQHRLTQELTGFLRLVESFGGVWTDPKAAARRQEIAEALEDQTDLQGGR